MFENTSRRSFVKGAALGAAALGITASAIPALADEPSSAEYTYADTIAWDGEYDVVVLGFGGSGLWATLGAAKSGANVLAVDVAPKGSEGGGMRVAGGMFLEYESEDDAYAFYSALMEGIDFNEDLARYYAEGLTHTGDYLESVGIPRDGFVDGAEVGNVCNYDLPGKETRHIYAAHETKYDGYIVKSVEAVLQGMSDQVDLWLNSPAQHLIQAPDTGTILGAEIEHDGEIVRIRALNGVILATGGYENNQQMMQDYLNYARGVCMTTIYNKGDGIRMAEEVGAELMHTFAYDGVSGYWGGCNGPVPIGEMLADNNAFSTDPCINGSAFAITNGGIRFMNEVVKGDHGNIPYGGCYRHATWGARNFLVTDAAGYNEIVETGAFDDWMDEFVSGDTIEELAEAIDINPDNLNQTVADWASAIEAGHDPICGRDVATMRAWADGPYYALPIYPGIHATRCGSRKNADMQLVGANGEPIPHLYGAGECSSIYVNLRGAGGSISECIILGSLAGEKAAEPKDPLPAYTAAPQVASDLKYTIGSSHSDLLDEEAEYDVADNQYIGTSENGNGGRIQIRATITDGTIDDIEVVLENETEAIGGVAFDTLIEQALAAQSADIDGVSGATFTSNAFKEALEDAMAQAGM